MHDAFDGFTAMQGGRRCLESMSDAELSVLQAQAWADHDFERYDKIAAMRGIPYRPQLQSNTNDRP